MDDIFVVSTICTRLCPFVGPHFIGDLYYNTFVGQAQGLTSALLLIYEIKSY